MPETTLIVHHEVGLHARPASLFVQTAKQFDAEIEVSHGDQRANAKSILGVLTLGAEQGAEITIHAEGQDAEEALKALQTLVESNFEGERVERVELEPVEEE
jgi:phosphocarrier protein HPr